jgi:hypothetical protein
LAVFLLLTPLGLAAPGAAAPTIVGTWDLDATDANGGRTHWTLLVKQDAGKLSGVVRSGDGYELPFIEPTFQSGEFRFQIRINPTELVNVTLKLDGDRLDGRFEGRDSGTGTIKATRVALNLSGTWTGEWETSPDGGPGPHYMVLKQDGEKVTGSAGPNQQIQLAIDHAKFAAGRLTFDIVLPSGPSIAFDFAVDGDTMSGIALMKRNGAEQRMKLSCKRL